MLRVAIAAPTWHEPDKQNTFSPKGQYRRTAVRARGAGHRPTRVALSNPGAISDEEDEHDQPSDSALVFGCASGLAAAGCRCPANQTGWQLRVFVCRVRRLAVDDVPPVQVGSEGGSDQADGRYV